jgi:hypothetical protein
VEEVKSVIPTPTEFLFELPFYNKDRSLYQPVNAGQQKKADQKSKKWISGQK